MKKLFYLVFLAVCLSSCQLDCDTPNNEQYDAVITNVYSGDTIEVCFDYDKPSGCTRRERVKLIGVKAPSMSYRNNPSEYYAAESCMYLTGWLFSSVLVELDDVNNSRTRDGYLRAYVWTRKEILNKKLLKNGYVKFDGSIPFNSGRMADFAAAEAYAKEWDKGMWN